MEKSLNDFWAMMLKFFPAVLDEYKIHIEKYGERLDTVVMEDIFAPLIIQLLKDNKDSSLVRNIFGYFEVILNNDDDDLINILSVTILELLGNDSAILKVAQEYMGPKTIQLQIESDISIGR